MRVGPVGKVRVADLHTNLPALDAYAAGCWADVILARYDHILQTRRSLAGVFRLTCHPGCLTGSLAVSL